MYGWLWLAAALGGSALGTRPRPLLGMRDGFRRACLHVSDAFGSEGVGGP